MYNDCSKLREGGQGLMLGWFRRVGVPTAVATCVLWTLPHSCAAAPPKPIAETIEAIVARMRADLTPDDLMKADAATVERYVTDADRETLATRYWTFRSDAPCRVSVMRHTAQATPPYWLAERGFTRTDLRVRNDEYEYEVWQKDFPAGPIGLGINGFDRHRPHYFVSVQPATPGGKLTLSGFDPPDQQQYVMRPGSTIYHDWPDLVLTEVPESLRGGILLPTIRGRAREAHLIQGFRATPFPSSRKPDLVALTWSGDPRTSVAIQWRTSPSVRTGMVRWRAVGSRTWRTVEAKSQDLHDARILNDPTVRRFTASSSGLKPGRAYEYSVGSPGGTWTAPATFKTAPARPGQFSFVWLSDTHNRPDTEPLLQRALQTHPDAAFCTVTGDLVDTGQQRDDWDQFFTYAGPFARKLPLVPTIGNHDTIDGLGADLYLSHFALPRNGAPGLQPERSYHFTYGNALFVALDCTDSIEAQTPWLDKVLRNSKATWKFALFHFPPYALSQDYPEIEREWVPLFERCGVDFVLCGHVHHLQRTHPLIGGKPAPKGRRAPIYLITVAVGQGKSVDAVPEHSVLASKPGPPLYHAFRIRGATIEMECRDATGKLWDTLRVRK